MRAVTHVECGDAGQSRDIRTIEWIAGVLRQYGESLCAWESDRECGWVELKYPVENVVMQTAVRASGRSMVVLADRLSDELARHLNGEVGAPGSSVAVLLDEAVENYTRVGGEIARHAMVAVLAIEGFRAGAAR